MIFRCAIAAALFLFSGAAWAQERPLTVTDASEAEETRIVIPEVARDHPQLYEEMLGAAEAFADTFRQEAQADFAERGDDQDFPWRAWTLDYVYEPRYVGPVYVSFLVNIFTYQGGAHPNLEFATMTRDREINQPVTLTDLFLDAGEGSTALVAISDYAISELARQKEQQTGEPVDLVSAEWLDAVAPRPENFERFTFEPAREQGLVAGLSFHFPPYAVGPYAAGPYEVFVPADVFADELAGFYPQVFGGEPVSMARLSSYEDPGTFVFLEAPEPVSLVQSPLTVAGEAPQRWFEAGEVRVRLTDFDGNVIGEAAAAQHPNWETSHISSGLTRFSAEISFEPGEIREGELVIAPAGERGSPVSAPVRF